MQVRVREITVGELRNLLAHDVIGFNAMEWAAGRAVLPPDLIGAFTDLTPEMVPKLTFSELETIIEAVKEVNAAFFFRDREIGNAGGLHPGDARTGIERIAAGLIQLGHRNVTGYGWSFFMTVLDTLRRQSKAEPE